MTYSIIAAEPDNGRIGAAIASRFLAVGSYCLYLDPLAGAVVTQSIANPVLAAQLLRGLADGRTPSVLLDQLLAEDPDADHRQTHLITPAGTIAVRTGSSCGEWAGHVTSIHASFAGNLLEGAEVLDAMRATWEERADTSMAERLIASLAAGERAGGDRRGMQAAAIRIHCGEIYPELDLRVDDCADSPVEELQRLYRRHLAADVQAVRAAMPRGTLDPAGPCYPGVDDLSAAYASDPGA